MRGARLVTAAPACLLTACLLTACLLTGCLSVGPNFVAPHEAVPDRYAGTGTATPRPAPAEGPPGETSFWWRQFHDPELERLETAAAAGNLDLKVAYLRFVESRLQVQQARAQGLPSLGASARYTREQVGLAGILKSQGLPATATTSAGTEALIGSLEKPVNLYQIGFDASWELDLFGRVRRTVEAAQAQSVQALESKNDLLVTLRAEVAQNYLQLRAGQVLRQITRDLIADQRDVVELTRNRQQHGLAGEADVESAQGQLSNLESQLPQYDQSVGVARHALAVLDGADPETLDGELADAGDLPALPADIDVGVPSALARRRPDIRGAEAALHAATAEVGVAVASLYPDVSLTGTYGLRNLGTRYLLDWSSKFYTAAPAISLPIFRGGSLQATIRLSRAQAGEAALNYRKTVLSALQEVEDGLTGLTEDGMRVAALRDSAGADQRALDINLDAYRRGLVSYLTVLTVQLQAVQARQQLAQAQLAQGLDVVKLYKALGGGWDSDDPAVAGTAGAAAGHEGAAAPR